MARTITTQELFGTLTDSELRQLFIRIRSGRDRAYFATGSGADTRYEIAKEASDLMNELHILNAAR
jgi:hypothetical protein